jgi:hypothetical protein
MKYQMNDIWPRLVRGVLISFLFAALTACTAGLVKHSFGFDALRDSPGIEVMDYRYGTSMNPGTHPPEWAVKAGQIGQAPSVNGEMLRGDFLYVKWRVESTGKVYEDTVDLKSRLPRDITNHEIYFIVEGTQLFVYLITPEKLPPGMYSNGPRQFDYLKVVTLPSNFGHEVTNP